MKKKVIQWNSVIALVTLALFLYACGTGKSKTGKNEEGTEQQIMVFAAASLTDVLSEIIDSFEVKTHIMVQTNMASSGTLARQIEQGGSPDIFISASKKWANYVDSMGLILPGFREEIAQNELVLIAPINTTLKAEKIDSTLDFISLTGTGRLSIGDPAHVPAGKYARQSLEYFGWYKPLENKTLPAKDVRSALMVVEMEESPIGIVYKTDAMKSGKVIILTKFPDKSHKPIVYVAGVCKDNPAAKEFFTFLNSGETLPIWVKYGFKK